MFTPGPTALPAPFGGLPGWRRISWLGHGARLRARYPTVIFNRGCGAKPRSANLRTVLKGCIFKGMNMMGT